MNTTDKQNEKPNILYLDDESVNLDVFKAQFRKFYNIFITTSPYEAVEILKNHPISLIITDQRMPNMTGVQFLEAVIPEHPDPIRMILTGFSDIDALKKAINGGSVLRYITKPWDQQELKQIIDMGIEMYRLEQAEKKLISDLETQLKTQQEEIKIFEKYIPENILNQFLKQEQDIETLEGEPRIVSMLFADIRNFTHFSEKLKPAEIVNYLNHYFSIMISHINKHHGFVYKLLGDGLIAMFGAPYSSINNQLNALHTALEMKEEGLKKFNEFARNNNYEDAVIGISICTTETIVGHIAAKNFITYEAIGSIIGITQEMEHLTRTMPNALLVCEVTFNALKQVLSVTPLDATIDGKQVKLYNVLQMKSTEKLS